MVKLIPVLRSGVPAAFRDQLDEISTLTALAHTHYYETHGYHPPWQGNLIHNGREFVGTCGFRQPPEDGRVEMALCIYPGYQDCGYGQQALIEIVNLALMASPRVRIAVKTDHANGKEAHLLRKFGFFVKGREASDKGDSKGWLWEMDLTYPGVTSANENGEINYYRLRATWQRTYGNSSVPASTTGGGHRKGSLAYS